MKKLMFVAAVAASLTGFCDVEGANIVGYQSVALPAQNCYGLLAPTFKEVGKDSFDLTEIKVVKADGSTFTSKKRVQVQKMDLTSGALTTIYQYTTAGNKWVSQSGADVTAGEVVFTNGEAMCVKNGDAAGSALMFQFSGEVELNPVSLEVPASSYTLIGNFTPVAVDLVDIVPYVNGEPITSSKKRVQVQKMDAVSGALTTIYQYTTSGNKWVSQTGADVVRGEVTFVAGEAMCVKNGDTRAVTLKFPNPVQKAE